MRLAVARFETEQKVKASALQKQRQQAASSVPISAAIREHVARVNTVNVSCFAFCTLIGITGTWTELTLKFAVSFLHQLQQSQLMAAVVAQVEICVALYSRHKRRYNESNAVQLDELRAQIEGISCNAGSKMRMYHFGSHVAGISCVRRALSRLPVKPYEGMEEHCKVRTIKAAELRKRPRPCHVESGSYAALTAMRFAQVATINNTDILNCMKVLERD
jgi:hypothetical protein